DRAEAAPEVTLAHRLGGDAPALRGRTLTARVQGSVYGLDGETGAVLWRRHVGADFDGAPLPLDADAAGDAIVCQPEAGVIMRVQGQTGEAVWRAELGTPTRS